MYQFDVTRMAIKRKRTDSEIPRSSSLLSPTLSNMMALETFQDPDHHLQTSSQFSSRAQKRRCDSRPSNDDVHRKQPTQTLQRQLTVQEHTLSPFFPTQQNPRSQQPANPTDTPERPSGGILSTSFRRITHQPSFDSFQSITDARETSPSSSVSSSSLNTPTSTSVQPFFSLAGCEDGDSPLPTDDGDVIMTMTICEETAIDVQDIRSICVQDAR